ncbi:MAG: type III secretion protein N (ATPase) [Planctomycetota bacterium]|jgi:type III secretion protein N (ATPase)
MSDSGSSIDPLPGMDIGTPDLTDLIGLRRTGRVTEVIGTIVRAAVPEVHIGELCRIRRSDDSELDAEVVGFDRQDALLMPLGQMETISAGATVVPSGGKPTVPCGKAVQGRVLDALGDPLDGLGPIVGGERTRLMQQPPNPLLRARIDEPIQTGVRAIDGMLTMGRGQRIGIFAGAGGGKSTLLSMIARNVDADRVVLALIGERGREVRGFLEDDLGEEGMKKSTIVVSTADQSALLRLRAAYTATAIAEAARDRGERVVLLMDSVTRFARALRDVGLAAGEPPGRQGFPASVFARLPILFERAGTSDKGSITAFYTVLVAGDDMEEPVADETMSLLDGHIILSRKIAERNQYPAIDILASKSRLMQDLVTKDHAAAAGKALMALSTYTENYDKISMGLYDPPTTEEADLAERGQEVSRELLVQDRYEVATMDDTVQRLIDFSG